MQYSSLVLLLVCVDFLSEWNVPYWGTESSQNEGSSVKPWFCSPEVEGVGSGVHSLLLQFVKLGFQFLQFMFRLQSRDVADIESQGRTGIINWWCGDWQEGRGGRRRCIMYILPRKFAPKEANYASNILELLSSPSHFLKDIQ